MPLTPPSKEPTRLVIGVNWEWDAHYSDTPPSESYSLAYDLHGPSSVAQIAAATSPDGDYYEVRRAAATTVNLEPGTYILVGRVTNGAEAHEVYRGYVALLSDVPALEGSSVTVDEQLAAALEGALVRVASLGFARVTVNGRTTEYRSVSEIRSDLGKCYARIRRAREGGRWQEHKISFRQPS